MNRIILFLFTVLCFQYPVLSQVPSYVPTNGLVGWWPFNGNANDESGNGNNGRIYGATLTADRKGNIAKAYSFDGLSNYIKMEKPGPIGNSSRSVSIWIRTNDLTTSILASWGGEYPSSSFNLWSNYGCTGFSFDINGACRTYNSNFSNDLWNHYVVVFDNSLGSQISVIKVYENGILLNTTCSLAGSGSINTTGTFPITLGKWCALNNEYLEGCIDDFAIWNRPLTQAEITALYQSKELVTEIPSVINKPKLQDTIIEITTKLPKFIVCELSDYHSFNKKSLNNDDGALDDSRFFTVSEDKLGNRKTHSKESPFFDQQVFLFEDQSGPDKLRIPNIYKTIGNYWKLDIAQGSDKDVRELNKKFTNKYFKLSLIPFECEYDYDERGMRLDYKRDVKGNIIPGSKPKGKIEIRYFIKSILEVSEPVTSKKESLIPNETNSKDKSIPQTKIGNQVWMTKNLDIDKFRNGDPIPQAKTQKEWANAFNNKQAAWCYYEHSTTNGKIYGKLYNWYAVNDPRGLAPEGWHIPSWQEFLILTKEYDKDPDHPFSFLKSTTGWSYLKGTNTTGFTALPGGYRYYDEYSDYFQGKGEQAYWWSSTENEDEFGSSTAHLLSLYNDGNFAYGPLSKGSGLSVRCMKGNSSKTSVQDIKDAEIYDETIDEKDYTNCYEWIKSSIEKNTTDTTYSSIDDIKIYDYEGEYGFTIRMSKSGYNGLPWILFKTYGSGECIEENNKVIIVFTDKSKIETTSNTKNNCKNNCWLRVDSKYFRDIRYKIVDKVQVYTKDGFVEQSFTKKQSDAFRATFTHLVDLCE